MCQNLAIFWGFQINLKDQKYPPHLCCKVCLMQLHDTKAKIWKWCLKLQNIKKCNQIFNLIFSLWKLSGFINLKPLKFNFWSIFFNETKIKT